MEWHKGRIPDFVLEFVDLGSGFGKNVYFDRLSVKHYIGKAPFVAHILTQLTQENFSTFDGLINLAKKAGYSERIYIPVFSYREIDESEVTIDLRPLSPEQLSDLGDHLKLAVYSHSNLRPPYIPYSQFINLG